VAGAPATTKQPAAKPVSTSATPWYMRPLAWVVVGLIVLLLIVLGLSGRRRRSALEGPARGPLADPDDVSPRMAESSTDGQETSTEQAPVETVSDEMQVHSAEPEMPAEHDPYGLAALREPAKAPPVELPPVEPVSSAAPAPAAALAVEDEYTDDPVDTKLDLARAYLDMGDPVGARAMLEEVLEEGSQTQKDEAKRLLADVEA
jgi:FimV-like protein